MKTKRIVSLLLGLVMVLALLPTASLATTSIKSFHVTVTTPVIGQKLRTTNVRVDGANK